MATSEEIEKAKKLREEYEQLKSSTKTLNDEEKKRLETLEKIFKATERTVKSTTEAVEKAEAYVAQLVNAGNNIEVNNLRYEAQNDLLRAQRQQTIALIKDGRLQGEEAAKQLKTIEDQIGALKKVGDARAKNVELLEYQTSLVAKTEQTILRMFAASKDGGGVMMMGKGLSKIVDSGADAFLGKLTSAAKEVFFQFDEVGKAFEKQYAMGERFKQQTTDIYKELDELSVTMEDVTNAAGALIDNFTDFTLVNKNQQKALRTTANLLEKGYGVAFDDFAKGLQSTTKAMGMSEAQAKTFSLELVATADALGVSVPGLSAQFASMGPQLAKFGTEGAKHFKELARLSKLTGLEIGKLLDITTKFDTFEGAAERAGMLNAALGGNFVNAMDLMMATDPAERFMMIRDAIDQTGLSFDEMGYYQKQFFAEAAGLGEVNDLALLMSGNMDLLTGATNQNAASIIEQKKRAQDMQTIMQKLQSVFIELVSGVVDFNKSVDDIAASFQKWGKTILMFVGIWKSLNVAMGIFIGYRKWQAANAVISIANGGKEAAMTKATTNAIRAQNRELLTNVELQKQRARYSKMGGGPVKASAASAFGTAATILATAAALVAFGKAVEYAGAGIAVMADAMSKLNVDQMEGLNKIMITLSLTMGGFAVALVLLAKAGLAAAGPMYAVAGAILAIGASIGLAAFGLSYLVDSFANLGGEGLIEFAAGLWSLVPAMLALAAAAMLLGNPLALAGMGALLGVGLITTGLDSLFGLFKKDKAGADDMGALMQNLGSVDASTMQGIENMFDSVKQSINRTSALKLAGYAVTMKSATPATQGMQTVSKATPGDSMMAGGGIVTPAQANNPSRASTEVTGEVEVKFNTDLFETAVVRIINKEKARQATTLP